MRILLTIFLSAWFAIQLRKTMPIRLTVNLSFLETSVKCAAITSTQVYQNRRNWRKPVYSIADGYVTRIKSLRLDLGKRLHQSPRWENLCLCALTVRSRDCCILSKNSNTPSNPFQSIWTWLQPSSQSKKDKRLPRAVTQKSSSARSFWSARNQRTNSQQPTQLWLRS